MRKSSFLILIAAFLLTLSPSCRKTDDSEKPLTAAQALQALDEAGLSSQAAMVVGGSIEISTNFTIGQAVEAAAAELRDFIASELPCADIALQGATLTITYGAKAGNCTYHGQTYSGAHSVTVTRDDQGDVVVDHVWDAISNGLVSVTGTATVTWSLAQGSRNVVHELQWTRLSDGRTGTGSGDRTQTALPGGILEGIEVNGSRTWKGDAGQWDLAINGVQARWVDPVPQAGTYSLKTPFSSKTLYLEFSRADVDTIEVTVRSGDKSFSFLVSKSGQVDQQ